MLEVRDGVPAQSGQIGELADTESAALTRLAQSA
jgi:hypothetical protein